MEGPHSVLYFREGNSPDESLSKDARRHVIDYIRANGVEPVIVRGMERFNFKDETVLPDRIIDVTEDGQRHIQTVPYDEPIQTGATSIRRYGPNFDPTVEDTGAIVINTRKIRELSEKDKVAKLLVETQPLTLVLDSSRFSEQLDEISTDKVVIKPIKGRVSKKLLIAPKQDIFDTSKFQFSSTDSGIHLVSLSDPTLDLDLDSPEGYVLQELIDTTQPFPEDIHVLESVQQTYEVRKFNPKEVRLMIYWDATRPDEQKIVPFARIFSPIEDAPNHIRSKKTHNDEWLLLDIEKGLPIDLDKLARTTVLQMLEYGNVKYLHGAIDVAFDGNRWYVMELNVRYPVPPSYQEAREAGAERLADVHREELGILLANAAKDAHEAYQTGSRKPRLDI